MMGWSKNIQKNQSSKNIINQLVKKYKILNQGVRNVGPSYSGATKYLSKQEKQQAKLKQYSTPNA
jgi:hypothetical protein